MLPSHHFRRPRLGLAALAGLTACVLAAPTAQADWRDSMREMAKQRARQVASEQLGVPTPALPGAQVYLINVRSGDTLANGATVRFGLKGMGVSPVAGGPIDGTGHFVLVVDGGVIDYTKPLPSNAIFRHFDNGQTETDLSLSPGRHTLQLMLTDYRNLVHQPALVSAVTSVTVR